MHSCLVKISALAICITYIWIRTCFVAFRHWFHHIPMSALCSIKQLPLSLSPLVNLIAFSWEIRWRPVSCLPLLRGPRRHSFQKEIKMASVNPAFQLQAVTQCVSLGTGWDCSGERYSRQGRYKLPSNVSENTAIICGPSEHSKPEINSTLNQNLPFCAVS